MSADRPTDDFAWEAFLTRIAQDAVGIRQRLDRQFEAELDRYAQPFTELAAVLGEQAEAVLPPQLIPATVTTEVHVLLRKSREKGFGLSIQPLNMGYRRRFGTHQSRAATMSVTITNVDLVDQTEARE